MMKLYPSSADRWGRCPGSAGMEAPYPRSPKHPNTDAGIALHWCCERVLFSWLPINTLEPLALQSFLGQACPENGVIIDEEMIWAGGVYLQTIWERANGHLEGLKIEQQLSAHQWIPANNGRTDAMWKSLDLTWLTVWDLKYGFGMKSAFENFQLINYGIGAISEHTQTVELVVVQPRGASAARPVKTWTLSVAEFWTYAQGLIDAAIEARGPSPRTVAGAHCRYCRAAADCPTLAVATSHAMDVGAAGIDVAMTERELAYQIEQLKSAQELVTARRDALDALALSRIQTGNPVPGFQVDRPLGNRSWTMPPEQIIALGELYDVDVEERKPLSPNKAEGRGLPRDVIDLYTERREGTAKLAMVDRNRAREIFRS